MKVTPKYKRKQLELALRNVWIADGKCLSRVQTGGIYKAHFPIKGSREEQLVWNEIQREALSDVLATKALHWSIWIGIFERDSAGNDSVDGKLIPIPKPIKANDLSADVENALIKFKNSKNTKHVIGYGWFAVPTNDVDLMGMQEEIVNKFISWGAFNTELVALTNFERAVQEQEKEMTDVSTTP